MSIWNLIALILTVNLLPFSLANEGYNFRLDMGNPDISCPSHGYHCKDGSPHFLCDTSHRMNPKCLCFNAMPMPNVKIKNFVRGTNGIRNKVATQYKISNMNLVYWSDELMEMAVRYLLECKQKRDDCLVIGEKQLKLSQNFALLKSKATDRWPGRVVRHWFMELGPDVENWDALERKIHDGKLGNFTNMVYPLVEFMGCAGAHFEEGSFIVCYYYPAYEYSKLDVDFVKGEACTSCIKERKTCSRTFSGLCGIDIDTQTSSTKRNLNFDFLLFINVILFLFM